MRISIPGLPGVSYDTDAESTAATVVLTAASRRAPTPHRYALQLLPHLWSFDVDLRDVPDEHPLQYLHPEGAHSVAETTRGGPFGPVGRQADLTLRVAWAVSEETESAVERLTGGRNRATDGVTIEVADGPSDAADE